MEDTTPVLIGVGEASERIEAPGYEALSPAELAGRAARAACEDALSVAAIAPAIDVVAAIRQFEISAPNAAAPFGRADNFPRAVARRIGADPARAVLEVVGGQGPQHLVNEFAHAIARGAAQAVLLCGAEAISTVRHLTAGGQTRDWREEIGGQIEDRGFGPRLMTADVARHGAATPIQVYALFENARRARFKLSREAYRLEMGALFAPFTQVAARNPHAMSQQIYSAAELATVTGANRLTADPFPRRLVSRDQTNQGVALVLTSAARARSLGVPADRFVYLHGCADATERTPMERADLSSSPAAILAARYAIERAAIGLSQIRYFDLYSCFPIAVFNVRDGLGLAAADPRPLTMTGGLPFFGGAGNNYSMHAIASMARALRADRGAYGFVGANGGYLSKYSVGVYSALPAPWRAFDDAPLQAEIDAWPAPAIAAAPTAGRIETYMIDYTGQAPYATIVGRTVEGERFVALARPEDRALVATMIANEPLAGQVALAAPDERGRSAVVSFTPEDGA